MKKINGMRIQVLLVILLTTVLFVSCKKDDPVLERDKFIGQWVGKLEKEIKKNGKDVKNETIDIIETIDAGSDVNQILFSKGRINQMTATIVDSTFTIPEQIHYDTYNDKIFESSIVGQGILSKDNVLTITSQQVTVYKGDKIEWICTEWLKLK
jgi:hypothetical protein